MSAEPDRTFEAERVRLAKSFNLVVPHYQWGRMQAWTASSDGTGNDSILLPVPAGADGPLNLYRGHFLLT